MSYLSTEIDKLATGIDNSVPKYGAADLEKDSTLKTLANQYRITPLRLTLSQMSYNDRDIKTEKGYTKIISYSIPIAGSSVAIQELEKRTSQNDTKSSISFNHGYPDRGTVEIALSLELKSLTDSREIIDQGYTKFQSIRKSLEKEIEKINKDIEEANSKIHETLVYELGNRLTLIKLRDKILNPQLGNESNHNDNNGKAPK